MTDNNPHFFGVISDAADFEHLLKESRLDVRNIPVLPCRGLVAFPFVTMPVPVGRPKSIEIVKKAADENTIIAIATQRDESLDNVSDIKELFELGVIARVIKMIQLPDGSHTAFIVTGKKIRFNKIKETGSGLVGEVEFLPDMGELPEISKPLYSKIFLAFQKFLHVIGEQETNELKYAFDKLPSDEARLNFIALNLPADVITREKILGCNTWKSFLNTLLEVLLRIIQEMEIRKEIERAAHEDMSRQQREVFLQQQIRTIQQELGQTDENDIAKLRKRSAEKNWDWEQIEFFDKEVKKLERFNPSTPDYAIQYNFLDLFLNLPWKNISKEKILLSKVEKILDKDHFGLEKVKERILEHTAVLKLRNDMKAPILCFFGPPGVGKTSLGKSIAEALGREYCRVSLGGLHDEAEIRGHRRTYIGALPGRIISALAKCKTNNPVFVLDEIDKIGKDFKGDPSTALLEVLDPEQNVAFHDNFLDVDYDLSHILFVATANDLSTISAPLRDRMEIIDIPGYIVEEKVEIALRHLVPKTLENLGLQKKDITFSREAIMEIIEGYTREAGVRQLEKKISKVLRKVALLAARKRKYPRVISKEIVNDLLGPREINPDEYENNDNVGVVTGLAWTQTGGEILFIESSLSKGKGEKLTITGNLGDVMKESAMLAMQYLKANADRFGINVEDFNKFDVHIHVPEGAVPKDGPSAGITMTTSLASSFTGRKVKERLAMTGEITLRGKVIPVGGIREKILAAKRAGIREIILSKANKKDIEQINPIYIEGLTFHYVDTIDEVLDIALL